MAGIGKGWQCIVDAEMDNDEEYSTILEPITGETGGLPVDQFYRVIKSS